MSRHNSVLCTGWRIVHSAPCSAQELCLADTAVSKMKLFIQTIYNFRKYSGKQKHSTNIFVIRLAIILLAILRQKHIM